MLLCYILYYILLLFAFLMGALRFSTFDRASKMFWLYIGSVLLTETIALYQWYKLQSNAGIYSVGTVIQFFFLCLFFNYSIDIFRKERIGVYLAIVSLIFGVLTYLYLRRSNELNYPFIVYSGACTIAASLIGFLRFLTGSAAIKLSRNPHFWLFVIILFYWSFSLLNWVVLEDLVGKVTHYKTIISFLLILLNILIYGAIGVVFILYPRLSKQK